MRKLINRLLNRPIRLGQHHDPRNWQWEVEEHRARELPWLASSYRQWNKKGR
jgi:hypothetical protein